VKILIQILQHYPVLRHWYLMMQNTYVRFPNWSKCSTVESNKSQQLCQFWRSLQLRNGKIRLSLKGFNFWPVGYCKGWCRADWHISEWTFALWGEGCRGRGQSLQDKDLLLLILQSFDWVATFHLDLLEAVLVIAV